MKKLIAVLGSSRKNSVSYGVAAEVIRAAEENGYKVISYYPGLMNLKGCLGCGSCKRAETDCVVQDDMQAYFKELHSCDAVVMAVPNYFGQPAGHMITFMNRHYCMTGPDRKSRLKPGIKAVGIFSQGAPSSMSAYQGGYDWYLDCFSRLGMEIAGSITVGAGTEPSEYSQLMCKAYELGKGL